MKENKITQALLVQFNTDNYKETKFAVIREIVDGVIKFHTVDLTEDAIERVNFETRKAYPEEFDIAKLGKILLPVNYGDTNSKVTAKIICWL